MKNALKASVMVAATVMVGALLASPAYASDEASDLPRVASEVSAEQLGQIGATQDAAEIEAVMALASPEQTVQVLLNFSTHTYDAAVLVDESPYADLTASSKKAPAQESSAARSGGIYTCSYTAGPKGISYHGSVAYYFCGSGEWKGGPLTNWRKYHNGASGNALVGPSNLNWMSCPPNNTCTIGGGVSLGYVSFN
ncbi:hypothetical protein ACF044_00065 [Microbacterium sp. NPDC016588]